MLLSILLIGLLLKKLNQPYFVAYIIAGILLGPYSIKVFTNSDTIAVIGELGLLIQMFFIGTNILFQGFFSLFTFFFRFTMYTLEQREVTIILGVNL